MENKRNNKIRKVIKRKNKLKILEDSETIKYPENEHITIIEIYDSEVNPKMDISDDEIIVCNPIKF